MDIGALKKKIVLADSEWIDEIPDFGDVRLKVRSTNYKPFQFAVTATAMKGGKKIRTGEGSYAFRVAMGKALAEHILTDWEGVTDGGKALKYSPAKALEILTSDDPSGIGAAFRTAVEWAGDEVLSRLKETAEDVSGN